MNANITRSRFITANELCAKHLGLRVRIETRDGARISDELVGLHAEVDSGDPERKVYVQFATVQPRTSFAYAVERGTFFDIPELSEVTVWENVP